MIENRSRTETLVATMDNQMPLDKLFRQLPEMELRRTLFNNKDSLDYSLIVETGYDSHLFSYDSKYVSVRGKKYKITSGDLVSYIDQLNLEWKNYNEWFESE
ncbi:hypothetical protein [Gracilibacillus timonensis]|nr:hypothetical protein [Gracilibacillus timonensis]